MPETTVQNVVTVKIGHCNGFHSPTARALVEIANLLPCEITVKSLSTENEICAKSILGLLTLDAGPGDYLWFYLRGSNDSVKESTHQFLNFIEKHYEEDSSDRDQVIVFDRDFTRIDYCQYTDEEYHDNKGNI